MNGSKRAWFPSALVLALALALPAAAWASKEPLKIGVPTALTGTYSSLGDEAKRAVEFAVNEANAAGGVDGRKVEVRFLDTEAKPELARQQAEKLALDGFNIMTATIASGEVLAIGPMLNRWNATFVASINKANDITGKQCQRRLFRVNRPDNSDAAVVQPWLKTRKEAKWAVVAADIAWGRNSGESFKNAAAATGKSVVSENYPPFGANDYAAHIQKVLDSGAEGVWVALAGRDAITFARQAKQFGLFDKVTTGGVSFTTDGTVRVLGDVVKGINTIINYSSTLDTPANKKFVADWAKAYPGDAPTNFQGEAYIGMQVIFQAVKKAGSVKPADVAKAISGGTFETILGTQAMRKEDNQLIGPNYFGIVEAVGGKLQPVINMIVPAEVATPAPDGSCKL
ncbi:MAG TPA: ABC transporter substrate-binding protein [Rubrivivax sp.]|nr:ABC transporter substrate-binding protein [Rubrivivax sp.]